MPADPHDPPGSTREFLALWNGAVEDHLVRQLAESLPTLARRTTGESSHDLEDSAPAAALARHLVRALRLSAMSGDTAAAVRYLSDAARAGDGEPAADAGG
jgi:hypothetical protein